MSQPKLSQSRSRADNAPFSFSTEALSPSSAPSISGNTPELGDSRQIHTTVNPSGVSLVSPASLIPRYVISFPNGLFLQGYLADEGCSCCARKSEAKVFYYRAVAERTAKTLNGSVQVLP